MTERERERERLINKVTHSPARVGNKYNLTEQRADVRINKAASV